MHLLPSIRSSRLGISITAVLLALMLYAIAGVRSPATSLLLSNLLQTAIVFLAAYCSVHVARRSSAYLRQLWMLLSAALFLDCAAQGLETYYQSFAHAQPFTPWPSDILFLLWVTPAVMMFLPPPVEDSSALDWQQVLDFAQIVVVALTAYL